MMKTDLRRAALALTALCAIMTAQAQLKQFTLEDLNFGGVNAHKFRAQNEQLAWWGDRLMRLDADSFTALDPKSGRETATYSLAQLNSQLGDKPVRSAYYAQFPYADKPLVLLANGQERLLYDFKARSIAWRAPAAKQTAADWCPASRATAYVSDCQLCVQTADGTTRQLTTDGSRGIVYGQSVHRDEFGICKGTFWSPDGQKLAFYRMDQTMVADYPQVNTFTREASPEPDKYPMAGMTSHKVTVGIYDLRTSATVYLDAGDPTDRYFTNIAWSPDSRTVYMIEVNRDQTDSRLQSYDPQTGKPVATLVTDHNDKYVHPMTPMTFLPWDSSRFLLQSDRDGYNHLYLYDTAGHLLRRLTWGQWTVKSLIGFCAKTRSAIIVATKAGDIQNNLYSVSVDTGKMLALDGGEGVHAAGAAPCHNATPGSTDAILSASGAYLFDRYTTPDTPRNIDITATATAKSHRLLTAPDPWQGYNQPEYTCGTITAADDSTLLYYRMVKPVDFDPNKRYPAIVYVYGGPGVRNVEASWHYASRSWETYMAQKGYLLFILDNRGSSDRGRDFEQATFRQLGQQEMKDQMRGVEWLTSLPYVDKERLGIHGWSFGGFMTCSLMTTYPDVFKVGVAGGPVIDWKWYEVMYGERYMDTPEANPEGYAKTSLLDKAKNLKGRLQIIIGMNDPTVVPQHALQFLNACTEAGTQPDFFVYPGEGHNMRGHKSVHLHERISRYFDDYLK